MELYSGRILRAKVAIARADDLTGEVFMHDHVLLLCSIRYRCAARLMMNVPSVHILCFIIVLFGFDSVMVSYFLYYFI